MANLVILPWAGWALWRMRRPRDPSTGPLPLLLGLPARSIHGLRGLLRRRRNGRGADEATVGAEVDPIANLSGTTNRFVFRVDQYVGLHFLRVLLLAVLSAYTIYGLVELKGLAEGLSYKEIAGQLGVSAKTVETYRARVAKKTGGSSRADLVRYAVRH